MGEKYFSNFLFGNINEEGELDDKIFDDEVQNSLNMLKYVPAVQEIGESLFESNLRNEDDSDIALKNPDALDYSDIQLSPNSFDDVNIANTEQLKMPLREQLAPLIPPELSNIDVRNIFPQFKYNEILRFNKLFGPGKQSSLPKIWRNFGKRKKKLIQQYRQMIDSEANPVSLNQNFVEEANNIGIEIPNNSVNHRVFDAEIDDEILFSQPLTQEQINAYHYPTLYPPKNFEVHSVTSTRSTDSYLTSADTTDEDWDDNSDYTSSDNSSEYPQLPLNDNGLLFDNSNSNPNMDDPTTFYEWERDVIINTVEILGLESFGSDGLPLPEALSAQNIKAKLGITDEEEDYVGWIPTATIRNYEAAMAHRQSLAMANSNFGSLTNTTNSLLSLGYNKMQTIKAQFDKVRAQNTTSPSQNEKSEKSFKPFLRPISPNYMDMVDWEKDIIINVSDLDNDPTLTYEYWMNEDENVVYLGSYQSHQIDKISDMTEIGLGATGNDTYYYQIFYKASYGGPPPVPQLYGIMQGGDLSPQGDQNGGAISAFILSNNIFNWLSTSALLQSQLGLTCVSSLITLSNNTGGSLGGALMLGGSNSTVSGLTGDSSMLNNENGTSVHQSVLSFSTTPFGLDFSFEALQHATPASELWPAFYPTFMGPLKLKHFHRPVLKRYSHGLLATLAHISNANAKYVAIQAVQDRVDQYALQRERERMASGGGDMFFMHSPADLSALDGELILAEYSEEYPPLMMNFGMATLIKNYHKRKPGKEANVPEFKHGTTSYTHSSPFLGSLAPGQRIQALENNMFRAPIYEHTMPSTDFVIIRTRNGYYIRQVKDIFTVGQECPLIEVPCPNSKKANIFMRDFLHVFLMRLFRASAEKPPQIYMDQVKRAFPTIAENLLRKKLKTFSDFDLPEEELNKIKGGKNKSDKSKGTASSKESLKRFQKRFRVWYLRSDFRIPPEEELREMVRPEHACAWYSGLAAEARLLDAGYPQAQILASGGANNPNVSGSGGSANDDSFGLGAEEEEELKVAPWNTTRAFLAATRGKCLLDLNGVADPTGCGQGFSYVRISHKNRDELSTLLANMTGNASTFPHNKPIAQVTPSGAISRKSVTGTDADLRKLSLKNAKQLLRNFDVPEEELKKLTRWEIIDVVRTLSTQQALLGDDSATKFARGSKFTATEHQEKFKEECQRIFDLQNKVLASNEILSSDEGSTSQDSDFEEMGKNIENMLANHKSKSGGSNKVNANEPYQSASRTNTPSGKTSKDQKEKHKKVKNPLHTTNRKLRITRTFINPEGKEFIRVETVRNNGVIEAYLRIRESKDPELLAYFSRPDESKKQEMLREKRRIVEQLRRLRAKEEKERLKALNNEKDNTSDKIMAGKLQNHDQLSPNPSTSKTPLPTNIDDNTLSDDVNKRKLDKLTSHINTLQKRYKDISKATTDKKAHTEDQSEKHDEELKLTCGACGAIGHMKTNKVCPLYIKTRHSIAMTQEEQEEYEGKAMGQMESEAPRDLVNVEGTKIILSKTIIQHYDNIRKKALILKFPKTITPQEKKELARKYRRESLQSQNAAMFRKHLETIDKSDPRYKDKKLALMEKYGIKIKEKSISENHPSKLTKSIKKASRGSIISLHKDDYLKRPNQSNKRRAIDPVVTLSTMLESVLNEMRDMPDTTPFLHPVNAKIVPDYYQFVHKPMDLQTMRVKIHKRKYKSREDFLADATQIVENSRIYNGPDHPLTRTAQLMLELCAMRLAEKDEGFMKLEKSINPLLDEDDQVALSFIFESIVRDRLLSMNQFRVFHSPVNPKLLPDYHLKVKRPIDLETIANRTKKHYYSNRNTFLADIRRIATNSEIYNGPQSPFTELAWKIYKIAEEEISLQDEQISELERSLLLITDYGSNTLALDTASGFDDISSIPSLTNSTNTFDDFTQNISADEDETIIGSSLNENARELIPEHLLASETEEPIIMDDSESRMSFGMESETNFDITATSSVIDSSQPAIANEFSNPPPPLPNEDQYDPMMYNHEETDELTRHILPQETQTTMFEETNDAIMDSNEGEHDIKQNEDSLAIQDLPSTSSSAYMLASYTDQTDHVIPPQENFEHTIRDNYKFPANVQSDDREANDEEEDPYIQYSDDPNIDQNANNYNYLHDPLSQSKSNAAFISHPTSLEDTYDFSQQEYNFTDRNLPEDVPYDSQYPDYQSNNLFEQNKFDLAAEEAVDKPSHSAYADLEDDLDLSDDENNLPRNKRDSFDDQ